MAEATTPPAAPPARGVAPRVSPGPNLPEVLVEVDNPLGRPLLWGPTQERLRARWSWDKLPRGSTSERGLSKMPEIPGRRIHVNPRQRLARIVDPLADPALAKKLAEISDVHKAIWGGRPICAVDTTERRGLSDNDVATWLYWIWRGVTVGNLRVVSGEVSSLEKIADAMPNAKIRQEFYNSLGYSKDQNERPAGAVREAFEDSYAGEAPPGAANL